MGSSTSKTAAAASASAEAKVKASVLASIAGLFAKAQTERNLIQHDQDQDQNTDLRGEFEAIKKSLEEQVVSLTEERDKARDEIREQGNMLAAVQLDRDELSARAAAIDERANLLQFGMGELNTQLDQALAQASGLQVQLNRSETEMQMLSNELAQIKTKHTQTTTLLDTRTAELKGAQAFLTKADSMSGAEVVRMVEGLDAEILQMSAFVADHFEFHHPPPQQGVSEEVQAACNRLAEMVGPKLVELLATTEHANDPMVVQLACQAVTAAYCRWIMLSWDVEEEASNHFLQQVYLTIQGSEEQSVAGRWRAITRTYVQSMLHGDTDVSSILVPHIASSIVDVLLVAGLQASEADIHNIIMQTFEEKMLVVVRLALALNWVTGREVTSADLEPTIILWDTVFDPATMEDVHAQPGPAKAGETHKDHVLCTTDLGLQRIVKLAKEKDGSGGAIQSSVLLKPKVVLHSVIESLEGVKTQIMESPASMATHELAPPPA